MNDQRFPEGWDLKRVQDLIAELDARTDDEWAAADEASARDEGEQAMVAVAIALLPEVRRLLATAKAV